MNRILLTISLPLRTAVFTNSQMSETERLRSSRFARRIPLAAILLLTLAGLGSACAQTATINWTNVHQVIDGFGAADAGNGGSISSANQAFFFGKGAGQLGFSLLRTEVTDGSSLGPGSCTSVGSSCAGAYVSDMKAMIANGGRVYAAPWSPPVSYKTNRNIACTNNAGLKTTSYAAYATWLANFVKSLAQQGVNLYALSVQNEPDICTTYDSAIWTAAQIETFVAKNLGPTFAGNKLSTLIFLPEPSGYYDLVPLGSGCVGNSSCTPYIGGISWHDYDASLSGTNTIAADPYPSGAPSGRKYWQTEASCGPGFGPNFCQSGFNTDITDALDWAAVIDQRIAVDGANAWLYWWLVNWNNTDDQGLMAANGTVPKRAYMMGQYSKFVRPGYYRIDATHLPNSNVSVSAYQNTATKTLVVIATNYSSSAVSQTFTLTNAPAFSTLTPTITSASLNLAQQASISVSSNSFTYTLPADSIATFVGSAP